MSPEQRKLKDRKDFAIPLKWTILTVVEGSGGNEFVPIVIDRFRREKDDVTQFVITTVANFHTMLEDLRQPIYPFKPGGRRRSKREMSDITGTRAREINQIEEALDTLTGERNLAIKIIRNSHDSEILGFEIFNPETENNN